MCAEPGQYAAKFTQRGGEEMRGKLRDKRDMKRDRLKQEMLGNRPAKRANRNLHLQQQTENEDDDQPLDEENTLSVEKKPLA
jgi:hypothetical protein